MNKMIAVVAMMTLGACSQSSNPGSSVKDASDILNVKYSCTIEHRTQDASSVAQTTKKDFTHEIVWRADDVQAPYVSSKEELDGYRASVFSSGSGLFQTSIAKIDVEPGKNLSAKTVANELPAYSTRVELDASFIGEGIFDLECKKAQ